MLVHRYIRLKNNIKVFCRISWRDNIRLNINATVWIVEIFGLKRKYYVLFGILNNLLATIQENISLMHDSINEKPEVTSSEKDKYIRVSSA